MAVVAGARGVGAVTRTFRVAGPLPGMNEIVAAAKSGRGKGNAYSRQKATWTSAVALAALTVRVEHFAGPVSLHCLWHERDARRDPDNVAAGVKFVLDGLVQAGILRGDGRRWITSILHDVVTDAGPGVTVTIFDGETRSET